MRAKSVLININLIPKDPFFQTPLGKVLRWALSVGRYLVIFTELVVIISFASRFYLDRRITDLNDEIHNKEVVILTYGDLEEKIRTTQLKIEQYQQISQQTQLADIFPRLSAITPLDVKLNSLSIKTNAVNLEGVTLSQNSLNLLINNLQLTSDFHNISIDKIESNSGKEGGFVFRIRFEVGQTPPTKNAVQKPAKSG